MLARQLCENCVRHHVLASRKEPHRGGVPEVAVNVKLTVRRLRLRGPERGALEESKCREDAKDVVSLCLSQARR